MSLSQDEWMKVANAINNACLGNTENGPIVPLEDVLRTLVLFSVPGCYADVDAKSGRIVTGFRTEKKGD